MKLFQTEKGKFSYTLERTQRRKMRIGIYVRPQAPVLLRIPHDLSESELTEILEKRTHWILQKQQYFEILKDRFVRHSFIEGESFYYLGNPYKLKVRAGSKKRICHLEENEIFIHLRGKESKSKIQSTLLSWYRDEAGRVIRERLEHFCEKAKIYPKRISIRNQKKIWGSCTSRHHLSFNWRLILLPISILDYVVAHEIAHLFHLNHSQRFWKKLESILPEAQASRRWLREHSMEYLTFPRSGDPGMSVNPEEAERTTLF